MCEIDIFEMCNINKKKIIKIYLCSVLTNSYTDHVAVVIVVLQNECNLSWHKLKKQWWMLKECVW